MRLQKVEVSHRTIVFTVVFLLFLFFLYFIRDIILQIFVALLITIILNPLVTRLSKYKVPRVISAVVIYAFVIGFLIISLSGLVPALVEQTAEFAKNLPAYISGIHLPLGIDQSFAHEISTQLSRLPQQIVTLTLSVFSNTISILTTIIISLYLVIEWGKLEKELENILGENRAESFRDIMKNLEMKLGGWARGQLILMFIVGSLTYIGLLILGIPYALPLAILAGLLELIPMMGPIVAAVPSVLIGFSLSPVTGVAVAALAFLIQQLENYVFVPNIMKKSVGISPVITLLALIVGFKLAGVAGAILSVPVVITLQTVLSVHLSEK